MELKVTLKKLKRSKAVEERIHEKIEKIEQILGPQIHVKWFSTGNEKFHTTDIEIRAKEHLYFASAKDENLYKSFDLATYKIYKQVSKIKGKKKHKPCAIEWDKAA